jgi:hypothetical protein
MFFSIPAMAETFEDVIKLGTRMSWQQGSPWSLFSSFLGFVS